MWVGNAAEFGALRGQLAHRACHTRAHAQIHPTCSLLACSGMDMARYMHVCRHGVQLC